MNAEGKFLHDLATPMATLLLILESLVDHAKNQADPNSKQVQKLESAMDRLNEIQTLIDERKESLIQRASP